MSEKPPSAGSEAKDRFREALERKRGQQHDRASHADSGSKVHAERAAASAKRVFRRKSG